MTGEQFTDRETATLLAALRLWQWTLEMGSPTEWAAQVADATRYDYIREIAVQSGAMLQPAEIDALANRINLAGSQAQEAEATADSCRALLSRVAAILERTWDHDDKGRRIDDQGELSGADVVDELTQMEGEIAEALKGEGR